jgi:hypothetical protein
MRLIIGVEVSTQRPGELMEYRWAEGCQERFAEIAVEFVQTTVDGLHKVCTALMVICYGKAEHPATNWQDRITARQWENAAKAMDATLPRAAIVSPAQP